MKKLLFLLPLLFLSCVHNYKEENQEYSAKVLYKHQLDSEYVVMFDFYDDILSVDDKELFESQDSSLMVKYNKLYTIRMGDTTFVRNYVTEVTKINK